MAQITGEALSDPPPQLEEIRESVAKLFKQEHLRVSRYYVACAFEKSENPTSAEVVAFGSPRMTVEAASIFVYVMLSQIQENSPKQHHTLVSMILTLVMKLINQQWGEEEGNG